MRREHAEHFWPWKPNADRTTSAAATSRSHVSSTIRASLPPISMYARLSHFWPGRTIAERSAIRSPTSLDPVKFTNRVLG